MLRVKAWQELFESAKSRTYNLKSQTYMPNKTGLGFRYLVIAPDGWAIYGVWCALVCYLSRLPAPRHGYLTDNGRPDGKPLEADDIAVLIGAPPELVAAMIERCRHEKVGWLVAAKDTKHDLTDTKTDLTDTIGIPNGVSVSPSLSPTLSLTLTKERESVFSPSSSSKKRRKQSADADFEMAWTAYRKYGVKKKALEYWQNIPDDDRKAIMQAIPDYLKCCQLGRTKSQFEGWINPRNRKWDVDWKVALADLTKEAGKASPEQEQKREEWRKVKMAVANAVLDAKEQGEDLKRVCRVVRDKYRGCPRWEGKDAVTSGIEMGVNSRRMG